MKYELKRKKLPLFKMEPNLCYGVCVWTGFGSVLWCLETGFDDDLCACLSVGFDSMMCGFYEVLCVCCVLCVQCVIFCRLILLEKILPPNSGLCYFIYTENFDLWGLQVEQTRVWHAREKMLDRLEWNGMGSSAGKHEPFLGQVDKILDGQRYKIIIIKKT